MSDIIIPYSRARLVIILEETLEEDDNSEKGRLDTIVWFVIKFSTGKSDIPLIISPDH